MLHDSSPLRILFVCMGNICRSPAGECVLRHLAEEAGVDDQLQIDSAGTINFHTGKKPDHRMREAALRREITIDGAARQVTAQDLADFDLILAADNENLSDLQSLPGASEHAEKIHLFCAFTAISDRTSVPDPYYGGEAGFELVLDLLERGCGSLIERIRSGEDLRSES